MFEGIYPAGNFSWHHLWFIAYLFVISLMISPLLRFFKSERFTGFIRRSEKFLNKPLALNIILMPLIGSQVLLRPYFPENTHDLVHDWAYIAYFIIFFLSGLFLLPNKNIAETIRKQRYLFLAETVISTILMFRISPLFASENIAGTFWDVSAIVLAWSCGLTAIGFSKQYLNKDSRFRKLANEAIYPFYLLHQPVIVVLGSVLVKLDISIGLKAAVILLSSFAITVAIYWFVIRPFNVCRVLFGMKAIKKAPAVSSLGTGLEGQVLGIGIRDQVSGVRRQVSGVRCQVSGV